MHDHSQRTAHSKVTRVLALGVDCSYGRSNVDHTHRGIHRELGKRQCDLIRLPAH